MGPALEAEGFTVVYASSQKYFIFRLLVMLWRCVTVAKANAIFIDTYSTKAFWYAVLCARIARWRKIPYLPLLHGGNLPQRLKQNPKSCQHYFSNAYQNITPSHFLMKELEAVGLDKVRYIPNALPLQEYRFKVRLTFEPNLLWVRAFATIYNPEMAVHVLVEVQKVYPKATLTMVGPDKDGSLVATKTLAKELGVSVTFTGQLSKQEWRELAAKHAIFINTTHVDNTPVSVLEAMALGLAIVSTNVGGIPDMVTNESEGLLVEDAAVSAMATAIMDCVNNPIATRNRVQTARKKVENFDWTKVKGKWIQLLEDLPQKEP
ncbi:glycosyltransferase family 4 protein [Flavobacterium chuncheonense]|uniref:Glycosyltransferase family 4 protein n=1 Tax=Flavobacterium chuncheonense TaxID=2026653 RepID=A0ABW5YIV4_9FLAO